MSRTRRRVAGLLLGALALGACSDSPVAPAVPLPQGEAAAWATWVLPSGDALRPPPPAGDTGAELREILSLQARPTAAELEEIRRWEGTPTAPWTAEAIGLLERYWILLPDIRTASPASSARIMALLHTAMYDALVASWDAKFAYGRPTPAATDARVRALLAAEAVPSYPSEHAAAAAAAAEVLKYAFPLEEAAYFDDLARRAGEARVAGGAAYRSDVEAGWALGRAVAARALARARSDGSDRAWTGAPPAADHAWRPTRPRFVRTPFDPNAGSWRTWVIPAGGAYRPAPPPAMGSARFAADLEELRAMPVRRTQKQADAARFWATDAPSAWWEVFAADEIRRQQLPALHAARAHALVSVAVYDAFVACWDAKFHYWLMRPISADSSVQTIFSTPPFPSYPSGHSTISAAAAEVFAYLFPARAEYYHARAHEASLSRVWGGVHFRFDVEVGEALGAHVGEAVVARARQDGSTR